MNSTKTMICAALSALIALLTSCSCPQSVTLTLRDQPGEILLPLQVNKDGNFALSRVRATCEQSAECFCKELKTL